MAVDILTIVATLMPIFMGLVAWIMNQINNRLTTLEQSQSQKVDKEDHIREVTILRDEMGNLRDDIRDLSRTIRDLPEQLLTTLQRVGKL